MKVGLSTKEKAKKYVKSRRIGIIDHIACVPRVISLRKGRIADLSCLYLPGTPRALSIGLVSLNSSSSDYLGMKEDPFEKYREKSVNK